MIKQEQIEFTHNVYEIKLEDLSMDSFPYSKVLQSIYGSSPLPYRMFKQLLKKYLKTINWTNLDLKKVKEDILSLRLEVVKEYPSYFEGSGWYDRKVYRELPGNEVLLVNFNKKKGERQVKEEKRKERREYLDRLETERKEALQKIKAERRELLLKTVQELGKTEFSWKDVKDKVKNIGCFELKALPELERIKEKVVKGEGSRFRLKNEPTSL